MKITNQQTLIEININVNYNRRVVNIYLPVLVVSVKKDLENIFLGISHFKQICTVDCTECLKNSYAAGCVSNASVMRISK